MSTMTTPENISEAIEQNALGPSSVANGSQSVSQHSLRDQIEADRYLATKTAASSERKGFGIRLQRIKPPGGG
jgi:hypothetical protein